MLSWLFGLKAEIRSLNADAASIVRSTREGRLPATQIAMVRALRKAMAEGADRVEETGLEDEGVKLLRQRHREARAQRNDVLLTGYTLAIIHARASQIGEPTDKAKTIVEEFLADWQHIEDEEEEDVHLRF